MDVKVLESSKKRMVVEVTGENATFCNILREELWNDKAVVVAAYKIAHPLIGIPTFTLETDGSKSPAEVFIDAAKRVKKVSDTFRKEIEKKL